MAEKFQKLELTWIGKGEEPKLEPRILLENPDYSYSPTLRDLRELRGKKRLTAKDAKNTKGRLREDYNGN